MNSLWLKSMKRPENMFVIIGFLYGCAFLVFVPPFQVADENRHFFRAFQVAEGDIIADTHEGMSGGWLPESIINCGKSTAYMRWRPAEKISRPQITAQFADQLNPENRKFASFASAVYSPVAYLPSALMIRIGIWLNFPPILLMYLGRMMNLVCWLLIISIAIKIIPFYKWVFFLLALTPMSLHQGASLSADCITNAIAFMTIAYFAYWIYTPEKKLTTRHYLLFFLLTAALSLSKIVFFLFFFLFLLIPREKCSSNKRFYTVFLLLAVVNILSCFVWNKTVKNLPMFLKPDVFPDQQIRFILTQPTTYLVIFFKNFMLQLEHGAKVFVGKFGWMDTPLTKLHFWSWTLVLFVAAITDGCRKIKVRLIDKAVYLSIAAGLFVLIVTLLYIYWNPVGAKKMYIVQGRYYIPFAPLFFICLYNRRLCCHSDMKPVIFGLCTFLSLTISLLTIYHRFYIP